MTRLLPLSILLLALTLSAPAQAGPREVSAQARHVAGSTTRSVNIARPRVTITPRYTGTPGYGFLPGYVPPEQRRRDPFALRQTYPWYGWPGYYRGRWNGGGFGPCYTKTPIGPVWNCG